MSTCRSTPASSSPSWGLRAAGNRPCSTSSACSIGRPAAPTTSRAAKSRSLPQNALTDIRKRRIGFIFQNFNLIDELTVRENVELALLYHGISAAERRARVDKVLDKVGIAHRAGHRPSQLSGGQQQRVAVARAVVAEPPLILADEPTGNLDTAHGEEVMRMLRSLNEEGATIVMVTHSPGARRLRRPHRQHARWPRAHRNPPRRLTQLPSSRKDGAGVDPTA